LAWTLGREHQSSKIEDRARAEIPNDQRTL
jgi:hypothetical protein